MHDPITIPDDLETCQQLLRELAEAHSRLQRVYQELLDTCTSMQGSQQKLEQERDELQFTIQRLLHQLYGRRSERRKDGEGQQWLDFGDSETPVADASIVSALNDEKIIAEYVVRRRQRREQPRSEELPADLERRTVRIEPTFPPGVTREDCKLLGIDVVETMQYEREKPWVRRIEYPKYKLPAWAGLPQAAEQAPPVSRKGPLEQEVSAGPTGAMEALEGGQEVLGDSAVEPAEMPSAEQAGRQQEAVACQDEADVASPANPPSATTTPEVVVEPHRILQAPREVTLIPGGRFGFGVATEVLFSKFVLHVPLYRQQDMWAHCGWTPHRSTLGLIVTTCADLLAPLADLARQCVLAQSVLGTDDTPVTLLTPGFGEGSREARLWLYRGPQRAAYNVFAFTDSRAREGPDGFLEPFTGTITGDCYSGYVNIEKVTGGRIRFSACLAHARRKVFESRQQQPALSSQVLALLGHLYEVEERAKGLDDAGRLALRKLESVPVMARLRAVLDSVAASAVLPKSQFGNALNYLRNHWSAFQLYLHDGRLPIDNNDVERELRRVALGRKNWLFVGSQDAGRRTATILTMVSSAYRHDLDVWAYLRDVLEQLARGTTDLASLLPDQWKAAHPEHVRKFREEEKRMRADATRYRRACRRKSLRAPSASLDERSA